jgi:haloalkane dehalogenase
MEMHDDWLASSEDVPKLLLIFEGPTDVRLMGPEMIAWCAENISNLEIEPCGEAAHVAPEDQPEAIAVAIAGWADRHQLRSAAASATSDGYGARR